MTTNNATAKTATMYHIPMCIFCLDREVQVAVDSLGQGFCSPECEADHNREVQQDEYLDSLLAEQYEQAPYTHGPFWAEVYGDDDLDF